MTRVIKIGGRPQTDPRVAVWLARDRQHDAPTILVHGGGDEVSSLQDAMGSPSRFVDGRRVTSESDIDIVRMALSGSANKRLVAALHAQGIQAIGLSGEDGDLITAQPQDPDRLGFVGIPCTVNVSLLHLLMKAGYMPVISPVSRNSGDSLGPALNVNGDDAASAVAIAMQAEELLLVSDVPGVFVAGTPVARLSAMSAAALIRTGTARDGMGAKLQAAITAIEGGVKRVRITDVQGLTDRTRGTRLMAGVFA